MNELLQKHGCANVFSVPEGLRELMSDISREVLREQPSNIYEFISNYLSVLLITREHGVLALRILDDLCDCKPSVSEHLMQLGMERSQADSLAQVIKEEIEGFEPIEGKEKVKETQIMKKILQRSVLDEDMAAKVCQVARNAYRDYWYRKKLLEQTMKVQPDEPWEIAAQHTLELYKRTKPSFSELTRATQKIQAAYRGYHVRKNLLSHLKPKRKKQGPKVDLLGPPIDKAASREIDLGPVIDIKVREDNVNVMFDECAGEKLGLRYDPMKTITHVEDEEVLTELTPAGARSMHRPSQGGVQASKSLAGGLQSTKSLAQGLQSTKSVAGGISLAQGLQSTKSVAGGISLAQGLQSTKSVAGGISLAEVQSAKSIVGADTKSRLSRPEIEVPGPRVSRLPSQMESGRQSRIPSQFQDQLLHKISFVEQPPEVIPQLDVMEEGGEDETQMKEIVEPPEGQEVQEEPGIQPAEAVEGEPAVEVPEDITDDRTEGDGESVPTASVPTSGPETADNTDVEDTGEETGEEEGE